MHPFRPHAAHPAILVIASASVLPLLAQDAGSAAPNKKQEKLLEHQSGFLGDTYSKLAPDPTNGDWLLYLKSPDALRNARSLFIKPVQVIPDDDKKEIPPEDLARLANTFTKDLREELTAGHYTLVDQPGPGVLTLRFAITDIEPNGGKTNAAVSGTEAVATHAVLPGAGMLIPRLKVGRASIEGEALEGDSYEVDMAFMTSKSGRRVFSGLKAFERWGDIDAALKTWAKSFRQRLDKAHQG